MYHRRRVFRGVSYFALLGIGLVPAGGCGGTSAPMSGNVVVESDAELAERDAESKRLDQEAAAEAKAQSPGRRRP